jgi:hypothetical protein
VTLERPHPIARKLQNSKRASTTGIVTLAARSENPDFQFATELEILTKSGVAKVHPGGFVAPGTSNSLGGLRVHIRERGGYHFADELRLLRRTLHAVRNRKTGRAGRGGNDRAASRFGRSGVYE